jgi:hypothetical protein
MNVRRFGGQGFVQEEDDDGGCSGTGVEPANSMH